MSNIETVVTYMVGIADNEKHGYDQTERYGPDYDCSSLLAESLRYGGFSVSRFSTTRNLYEQLIKLGFVLVTGKPKRGDIYLTPGKHCVLCVNENTIVHASKNENGKAKGGKTGDQTGKEICTRSFYTPSYGWKYHLRYEGDNTVEETKELVKLQITLEKLKRGYKGGDVGLAQTLLLLHGFSVGESGVDESFGKDTLEAVKEFQKAKSLKVDGVIGINTWSALLNV